MYQPIKCQDYLRYTGVLHIIWLTQDKRSTYQLIFYYTGQMYNSPADIILILLVIYWVLVPFYIHSVSNYTILYHLAIGCMIGSWLCPNSLHAIPSSHTCNLGRGLGCSHVTYDVSTTPARAAWCSICSLEIRGGGHV